MQSVLQPLAGAAGAVPASQSAPHLPGCRCRGALAYAAGLTSHTVRSRWGGTGGREGRDMQGVCPTHQLARRPHT